MKRRLGCVRYEYVCVCVELTSETVAVSCGQHSVNGASAT